MNDSGGIPVSLDPRQRQPRSQYDNQQDWIKKKNCHKESNSTKVSGTRQYNVVWQSRTPWG